MEERVMPTSTGAEAEGASTLPESTIEGNSSGGISAWLPRVKLTTPLTVTGSIVSVRHRGRFVFFCTLSEGDDETEDVNATKVQHELIFRGTSTTNGEMPDDELRWLKRRLRMGDRLRATAYAIERGISEETAPLLHVRQAELLELSLRSNTGREHTRVAEAPMLAPGADAYSAPAGKSADGDGDEGDGEEADEPSSAAVDAAGGDEEAHGGGEARRQDRARIFVEWVQTTFAPILASGGTVLDVAGGKGELCFHLTLAGIRCTLVDPRPSSGYLSKWQRKRLRRSGLPGFGVAHEFFGEAGADASAALARDAILILGMHPDEVTEPIVDTALQAGKPFAVVPCCVFSRLFPARRLPGPAGGVPVTTHPQFCEYLRAKDPEQIRLARLPFAGKQVVVYSLGKGAALADDASGCIECADADAKEEAIAPARDTSESQSATQDP